jgi:CheY-like chemotaxis protein
MEKRMAVCFHPTTVVLIDDQRRFLRTTGSKVRARFPYREYDSSTDALQFFTQVYKPEPFVTRCMFLQEDCPTDEQSIDISLRLIRDEIHNTQRYDEISVIVVDFAMPDINGIEFCRQLKKINKTIKILMLTGEADYDIAAEAYSNKLIDKFILKSAEDRNKIVLKTIEELQHQYFEDLSRDIINTFANRPELPATCLTDPVFIGFFENLCKKHKVAEYYITNGSGSFLFLDKKGNQSWLAVASEQIMKDMTAIAKDSDAVVAPAILESLRNREKLVYLHTDEELRTEPTNWAPYLYPANKMEGESTYYWAYINKKTRRV